MSTVNNDIRTLEFPENIRTRPVMYMNDILHSDHALTETVDNAADHVFRDKSVTKIEIKMAPKKGDYFFVANDGSSFPIGWDEDYGRTKMHLAVDQMHSGSNFEGGDTSVGQNGVGLKGCNALSSKFMVLTKLTDSNYSNSSEVVKSNYKLGSKDSYYVLYYEEGILKEEFVAPLDSINTRLFIKLPKGYTTYVVSFPDPKIYENPVANLDPKRLSTSILIFEKFYKRKIQYILDGKALKSSDSGFKYNSLLEIKIPGLTADGLRDDVNFIDVKLLLNFEFDKDLEVMTSGGNVNTRNVPRGHHINIGRERLASALKKVYDIPHNHLQKGMKLEALLLAPGAHLQLAGQTKDSLIRIKCFTDKHWDAMEKQLIKDITKEKLEISVHVQRLNDYALTLDKLAAKDYVKMMVNVSKNAGPLVSRKVRDAASLDRKNCNLYIVEGKSAASSLLEARDVNYDAVFAMRGFCLNAVGLSLEEVFKNEEFKDLVSAIGSSEPLDKVIYHDNFFNCWDILEDRYEILRQSAAKLSKKYNLVYLTVNINSGEYYIGVHGSETSLSDAYKGSGKLIANKLKIDRGNYIRINLFNLSTRFRANIIEAILVDEDLLKDSKCLNLVPGGSNPPLFSSISTKEERSKISKKSIATQFRKGNWNNFGGRVRSFESRSAASIKGSLTLKSQGHIFFDLTTNQKILQNKRRSEVLSKNIFVYDLECNFIGEFLNKDVASTSLKVSSSSLFRDKCFKYITSFKYLNNNELISRINNRVRDSELVEINKEGNLLHIFSRKLSISKSLGVSYSDYIISNKLITSNEYLERSTTR